MDLMEIIKNRLPELQATRKKLHENAELAFNEFKTREIIMEYLKGLNSNIEIKTLAKTGISASMNVANISTDSDSPEECLAVRADMDALPINGASHLCGHDYHMAVVLGVIQALQDIGFDKCIKFIFQPAEEASGGAKPMIEEGVLENPKVKEVIGFHVWPEVPVGKIEVAPGPSMGSVDDFHITFKGKGGHAAMPHKCLNPIYPAVEFIQAINIKSRIEQNPLQPHILTVSSITSGRVPNVIEDEAKVLGTVRTFDNEQRMKLHKDIVKCAEISAEKFGCEAAIRYDFQYPPVISETALTEKFITLTKELLGSENVLPLEKTFAAEDFSFFAEKVPSVHFRLGIAEGEKGMHPLHNPNFDASEDALFYGIYVITNFILKGY